MKQFLSILLIAAGLFGLYGDYVNITDVLSCKEYWEETSKKSEDDLNALGAGLTKLKKNRKAYDKTVKQIAKGKKSLANAEAKYAATGAKLATAKKNAGTEKSAYQKLSEFIKSISTVRTDYSKKFKSVFDKMHKQRSTILTSLKGPNPDNYKYTARSVINGYSKLIKDEQTAATYSASVKAIDGKNQTAVGYKACASYCAVVYGTVDSLAVEQEALYTTAENIYACRNNKDLFVQKLNDSPETYDAVVKFVVYFDGMKEIVDIAKEGDMDAVNEIMKLAKTHRATLKKNVSSLKWAKHYVTDDMKTFAENAIKNADKLAKEQDKVAKEVASITSTIYDNSKYKKAFTKKLGKKSLTFLKTYKDKKNSPLSTAKADFVIFEQQMDKNPGISGILYKTYKLLTLQKNDVKKEYTKANSKYKAYLKLYKAYPAKLETAKKKIAALEKKKAEYEAGEKKSKKGLEALVNKEPEGDLESVKDRIGGQENFTEGKNGHLDIDKGMEAVDAGEAYLNEAGDMIRTELMGRAIGTVMAAIAAALALLAALLSLFRSNRGGAMLACISAVVAVAGIAMGKTADTVFSELAGSTVGELPWTAAMVLAGTAIVFAIVHFTAKIEE